MVTVGAWKDTQVLWGGTGPRGHQQQSPHKAPESPATQGRVSTSSSPRSPSLQERG